MCQVLVSPSWRPSCEVWSWRSIWHSGHLLQRLWAWRPAWAVACQWAKRWVCSLTLPSSWPSSISSRLACDSPSASLVTVLSKLFMFFFSYVHLLLLSSPFFSSVYQGPFVHIASICAASLSQFMSFMSGVYQVSTRTWWKKIFFFFCQMKTKRDIFQRVISGVGQIQLKKPLCW